MTVKVCSCCKQEKPISKFGAYRSEFKKDFDVDHDHITGKVRGLLCSNCNLAVGNVLDSALVASKLASYLVKHKVEDKVDVV